MARQTILDRFRPLGAPGPAGPAGVAAADETGPAAELAPVFGALADDVDLCRGVVDEARQEAATALARAHESAAALVAEARLHAGAEHSRAAAVVEQAAAATDARLLATARVEADEIAAVGAARLPGTVRRVMDTLLAENLT